MANASGACMRCVHVCCAFFFYFVLFFVVFFLYLYFYIAFRSVSVCSCIYFLVMPRTEIDCRYIRVCMVAMHCIVCAVSFSGGKTMVVVVVMMMR